MEMMTAKLTADVNVVDAFRLLKAGVPIYIASAPEATGEIRLREAWKDDDGDIRYDYSAVYLAEEPALTVARAFNQPYILALTANPKAKAKAYLLPDTIRNRVYALRYAGGYISDGTYLMTAVEAGKRVPFGKDAVRISVDVRFPSTK